MNNLLIMTLPASERNELWTERADIERMSILRGQTIMSEKWMVYDLEIEYYIGRSTDYDHLTFNIPAREKL